MVLNLKSQKFTSFLSLFLLIGFCLTSIINIQKSKLQADTSSLGKTEYLKQEQAQRVALSIQKKIPAFGFSNLIADWTYLQFLQYFGDSEAREKIGYSLSPEYFEILVDNDPRFVRPYFLMSPATSIFAGHPEKSVALISKGFNKITPETHPQSYYLWLYKATDEMLFLGDMESAKQSYQMAIKWAEKIDTPAAKKSAKNIRQTAKDNKIEDEFLV